MAICGGIVSLPFGRLLLLQSTIALRAILACAVSSSNAAHASQSPQSDTRPRACRSQGRLLTVITHAQQLQCDMHCGSTT